MRDSDKALPPEKQESDLPPKLFQFDEGMRNAGQTLEHCGRPSNEKQAGATEVHRPNESGNMDVSDFTSVPAKEELKPVSYADMHGSP